jgi:hypothetical protein
MSDKKSSLIKDINMNHIKQILGMLISAMILPVLTIAQTDTSKPAQYKHVEIVTFKP